MSASKDLNFIQNTLPTMSGRSLAACPGLIVEVISSHVELQVKVMNRCGLPNLLMMAIASWYSWCM